MIADKSRITADIINSIMTNGKYPEQILDLLLRQIQNEAQGTEDYLLNASQAGFLRAYLIQNKKESVTEMLDTENRDPGYLCGRIFAAAVNIERALKAGEQTRRTVAAEAG